MKNWLKLMVGMLLAIPLVYLALANRQSVVLSFDPISGDPAQALPPMPLFLVIVLALMVGIVIGSVVTWIGQGRQRRAVRQTRQEVAQLRSQLVNLPLDPAKRPG